MTSRVLAPFVSTIFADMTALAIQHDAVNLGQGFPDFDGPERMLAIAQEQIAAGNNQYPPGPGILPLREAISNYQQRRYQLTYDPQSEILVTVGATEAIAAAMLGLLNPGDEVIIFEPYYDSYAATIAMAHAHRIVVPLGISGSSFYFDFDALRAAITPKTKVILFNTPHNPTGLVATPHDLQQLGQIAEEYDLIVVTDEVYEHLSYTEHTNLTLAALPGLKQRTLRISSAAKMFNVTGWKIGWISGPVQLIAAVKAAKQFLTFVAGGPFQPAIAYALNQENAWVDTLNQRFNKNRATLTQALQSQAFPVFHCDGGYFVIADVQSAGYADAYEFCLALPAHVRVAAIPVTAFVDNPTQWKHFVRFAFCKKEETLALATQRLAELSKPYHP